MPGDKDEQIFANRKVRLVPWDWWSFLFSEVQSHKQRKAPSLSKQTLVLQNIGQFFVLSDTQNKMKDTYTNVYKKRIMSDWLFRLSVSLVSYVCIVHFCHRASSCLLSFGFYSLSIVMVLFWYGFWSIVSFEFSFFPFWRPSPKCPLTIVSKVFCLLYFVSRIFSWSLSVSCLVLSCFLSCVYYLLCLLSFVFYISCTVSCVFCLLSVGVCLLFIVLSLLLSFAFCQLSCVPCLLSLSSVLSQMSCVFSFVICLFSIVIFLLSFVNCLFSFVICLLSFANCLVVCLLHFVHLCVFCLGIFVFLSVKIWLHLFFEELGKCDLHHSYNVFFLKMMNMCFLIKVFLFFLLDVWSFHPIARLNTCLLVVCAINILVK